MDDSTVLGWINKAMQLEPPQSEVDPVSIPYAEITPPKNMDWRQFEQSTEDGGVLFLQLRGGFSKQVEVLWGRKGGICTSRKFHFHESGHRFVQVLFKLGKSNWVDVGTGTGSAYVAYQKGWLPPWKERKPSAPKKPPSRRRPAISGEALSQAWDQLVGIVRKQDISDFMAPFPERVLGAWATTKKQHPPLEKKMIPASYATFVQLQGCPMVYFGARYRLAFLPPAWQVVVNGGLAPMALEEGHVLFAVTDLNQLDGFSWGPAVDGSDAIHVHRVVESCPEQDLGPFEKWFLKEINRLQRAAEKLTVGAIQKIRSETEKLGGLVYFFEP